MTARGQSIGVIIVAFNSADVIAACLDGLAQQGPGLLRVVVVDNASPDTSTRIVEDWSARNAGLGLAVTVVHSPVNRGFAGGVNLGLATLAQNPEIAHFWVLNPDASPLPGAAAAILEAAGAAPGYGMLSGRICYAGTPARIQTDGGRIHWRTGVTSSIHSGLAPDAARLPSAVQLDFVSGASMVVSRAFLDAVGPMREDYFLYYEEVDWALRRGTLPIVSAPGLQVIHQAGSSIGSATVDRMGSPFSIWFLYRSRMMFLRRFRPSSVPLAVAYGTAKALHLALRGAMPQAASLIRALYGLAPPQAVRARLSPAAYALVCRSGKGGQDD